MLLEIKRKTFCNNVPDANKLVIWFAYTQSEAYWWNQASEVNIYYNKNFVKLEGITLFFPQSISLALHGGNVLYELNMFMFWHLCFWNSFVYSVRENVSSILLAVDSLQI